MRDNIDALSLADFLSLADSPGRFEGDVILGGGVCGCLLAHELLVRTDRPVWIIEAGGRQVENSLDRSRPARWLHLLGSTDDHSHSTMANAALAGRALAWPRGRGLGGSGRINSMIWMPPHADDFQCLSRAGLDLDAMRAAWKRAKELIAVESPRYLSASSKEFLSAVDGHPEQGVFSAYRRINRNGRRWTTEQLLVDASRAAPGMASRLRCIESAAVSLDIAEDRLASVTLRDERQARVIALGQSARVISCLGSLGTPALLMRSGVGAPEMLRRAGVMRRVDLPAVGQNLHDHLIMPVVYDRAPPAFLPGPPSVQEIAQWEAEGSGPLASNIAECGGFDRDARFQLHVTPTDYLRYPQPRAVSAMTLGVQLTRPLSRGWLEIAASTGTMPAVDAGLKIHSEYMTDPSDAAGLLEGVRWVRELAGIMARECELGVERVPGVRRSDDRRLLSAIARYAQTLYHPGGTCAIGDEQAAAVANPDFQVRGVPGLSIVDASLLPEPTTGNPTALLAMLTCYAAERLSAANIDSRMRC